MPKRKVILIIVSVILAGLLVYLGYFLGMKWKAAEEETKIPTPEDLRAGTIGEVFTEDKETGEEKPLVTPTMPSVIFSTSGVINEVKSGRVILRGDGNSFADGLSRDITAIFTDETITFNKGQTLYWKGMAGLEKLQSGMKVLIEGFDNIRGKTEFQIKTINLI